MPPATTYIEDLKTKEARALDEAFNKEMEGRQKQYVTNWKYYYGDHKKALKRDKTNTEDNITVNLIELLCDKSVSGLMGTTDQGTIKGPDFDIPETEQPQAVQRFARGVRRMMGNQPQESAADTYLDKVWEANTKSLFLHDLALSGAVCGHNFVKLVPDGLPDPDSGLTGVTRLVIINPATIAAFWDADDISHVLWYRIQYENNDTLYREDTIRLRQEDGTDGQGWEIRTYTKKQFGAEWVVKAVPVTWAYAWPPIIDWKNFPKPFEYYGLDDIRANGNLNDGLNFTASNMQRIIKNHAHPKTIGTGFQKKGLIEESIGSFYTVEAADAKVYNLEMKSDLTSSMAYMHFLRQAFFDSGRELDPATVQDKLGAMTNFGLRVLFRDSLEKIGTKRLLYGHALRNLCRYLLEIGGFGANQKVLDIWPDPLPSDGLQTAQALQIDRQNGLSQSTYLERRGFDPMVEAQNRENEIGETVLASTVANQGAMVDKYRSMNNGNGQRPQTGGANGQSNPAGNAR